VAMGDLLLREINPASQVCYAFRDYGGGYQVWESGPQRVLKQIDLLNLYRL
jgi:hypothetical protein